MQSVLDQQYENWELIIVDDGSSDDTKQVVHSFMQEDGRIRYFFQSHQERSTARNKGIQEAKGAYICFLDDDDYYLANHLLNFYEYLDKNNFPSVILRVGFLKKKESALTRTPLYEEKSDINPVRFAAFNFCGVWSLCIPQENLQRDYFPPAYRHWQDTHLILRLLTKFSFHQLKAYSYVYVIHPTMGSKTIYDFEDAWQRINSNVGAMVDLFHSHGDKLAPYLPPNTRNFLVTEKYLGHANGALKHRRINIFCRSVYRSLQYNQFSSFWVAYLKLFLKFPFYSVIALFSSLPKSLIRTR